MILDEAIEGDPPYEPDQAAEREDLLKMHAYRDAIRRSVGAYVLYPGTGSKATSLEFHEILPGIGAFPLRPAPDGEAAGRNDLEMFLRDVTRQVANQASAMERTQYWTTRFNRRRGARVRPVEFLTRPPADTLTIVGYVRGPQLPWVIETKQYNVRIGNRRGAVDLSDGILTAELLVLWTEVSKQVEIVGGFQRLGPWTAATADELAATGYPIKDSSYTYLVTTIEPLLVETEALIDIAVIEGHPKRRSYDAWPATWAVLTGVGTSSLA